MYHKVLEMLVAVVVTLMSIRGVATQASNVTCPSSFSWANNQLNQNPCIVASYLEGVCNDGEWDIPSLPSGTHYIGPTVDEADSCQCNSVVYSLISACAACQDQIWISWDSWNANCTTVYPDEYPNPIPQGTVVPEWAYLNVTAIEGGTFNVTVAQQDLSAPASSSSHTGAIVGGVVGGVAGLAIITAGAIWFMRRRARSANRYLREKPSFDSSPIEQTISPYGLQGLLQVPTPAPSTRLYDPDDPSTFPHSPGPSTTYTADPSGVFTTSTGLPPEFQAPHRPGHYTGAPEV